MISVHNRTKYVDLCFYCYQCGVRWDQGVLNDHPNVPVCVCVYTHSQYISYQGQGLYGLVVIGYSMILGTLNLTSTYWHHIK